MSGKKVIWPVSGEQHHDIDRKCLFVNSDINSFLNSDQKTILIATKGMGKTLLLRVKKKLVEEGEHGELIIPRNQESDEPQFRGEYPYSLPEEVDFWKDIWCLSIILSILTHWKNKPPYGSEELTRFENSKNYEELKRFVNSKNLDPFLQNLILSSWEESDGKNPSFFLSELITENISAVQKLRKKAHCLDEISTFMIKSACNVFIDAFDQTLTDKFSHNLNIWCNAQLGLLKAVHKLFTKNKHIKVFVSIRQEAWSKFTSDDTETIRGKSIILEYSKRELKLMFEHAIRMYTKYSTIERFLGVPSIHNGWCGEEEKCFNYIYRHSARTPRSIMVFGSKLHHANLEEMDKNDKIIEVRKIINKTGSENIFKDYLLGQKRVFLQTLISEGRINNFLSLLPSNVLPGKSLKHINKKFSSIERIDESSSHPFCELFNIGLIGTVKSDSSTNKKVQYFSMPYDFKWKQHYLIDENSIYLIHSCLHKAITDINTQYYLNPVNVIGDDLPWGDTILLDNKKMSLFPNIFISHSSLDKLIIKRFLPIYEYYQDLSCPSTIWYDEWSIKAGGYIHQEVERGISGCEIVLVFISIHSLTSGWVEREWRNKHLEEINENEIKVIAVIFDNTDPSKLPGFLKEKKAIIIPENDEQAIEEVLKKLSFDVSEYLIRRRKRN